jgi:hypothetical protein
MCRALLVTMVLASAVPGLAYGDDGVFRGAGGAVVASTSASVRMTAEEVVLDLQEPSVVHGTCTFVFTNAGAPESLLVGFPDSGTDIDDSSLPDSLASSTTIYHLRVTVDGQDVATTLVPLEGKGHLSRDMRGALPRSFDLVHTWTCFFDSMQTRILRTEYWQLTSTAVWNPCIVHYVLSTGGSWAGPIGKAVVRVLPGSLRFRNDCSPPNWTWTGSEYVWTAEDFEPETDIELSLQDPAEYAACLIQSWQRMRDDPPPRSPYDEGGLLSACGPIQRADFLEAVCAQLGDSLAYLRYRLEDIHASENPHGR